MSSQSNKQKKEDSHNKLGHSPKNDLSNTLIGNKRERPKSDEKNGNNKICDHCNTVKSDFLEIDDYTPNKNIIDFISKNIKDENLRKHMTDFIIKKFPNKDKYSQNKSNNNQNINKNIICIECFIETFTKGGLEKIFIGQKNENNYPIREINNNEQKNNLKEITDLYSINLNLAISTLKQLKVEYHKTIKSTNDLFSNLAIQIMLSNNKEPFQDLKRKMDNCTKNLKEIEENFESLINDLTSKEELKKIFIEGIYDNDNFSKNNLIKILKKITNEIEFSNLNINGAPQNINNGNEKNLETPDITNYNVDNSKNDIKNKQNNDNKNNNNGNKNNIQNNINNNQLLNIQNQKKQNYQDQKINNNILSSLSQNNLIQNSPESHFIGSNLGLFSPFSFSQNRVSSNALLNNFFSSSSLGPQLLNQTNNNSQINSLFPNNNSNESSKNINNLNNMSFSGLNNSYLQRPNFLNTSFESLKEIEMLALRNILNNNQNNLINNMYNNQINPILNSSSSGLNNYNSPSSSLYYNLFNLQNNNGVSNLNQAINNNNIDQNKINQLNLINRDRINVSNLNNNNKGTNINNISNNINNMNNNINSMNSLNNNMNNLSNINNINNLNSLGALNGLGNNLNISDINNNINKLIPNQNIHNLNTNNNLYQVSQMLTSDGQKNMLVELFNNVAREKEKEQIINENNSKNNNNLNNNTQLEMNVQTSISNEQNNLQQINPYTNENKNAPINDTSNNNINNNELNLGNTENNKVSFLNNINNNNESNAVNNEKEEIKKEK